MSTTIDLINGADKSERIEMFKHLAASVEMPLADFFDQVQQHMVEYPLSDLSKYLVELSDTIQADYEQSLFDTRIRSAAIMLETLEGRALAYASENEDLRANYDALRRDIDSTVSALEKQMVMDGRRFTLERKEQLYILTLFGETEFEHERVVLVERDGSRGELPSFVIEPTPVRGKWRITHYKDDGNVDHPKHRMLLDQDAVDLITKPLDTEIEKLKLLLRDKEIALDAKDQRMLEMEEQCKSYDDLQRDRARLQEQNNNLKTSNQDLRNIIDNQQQLVSNVDHPKHYNSHPKNIECIDVVEGMGFNVGNAIKYLWRAELKGKHGEDLEKALWYTDREISRTKKGYYRKALKQARKWILMEIKSKKA